VDFHGKFYEVDSAPIVTHPIQQPMPLWYATMTPDRARWCARNAMPMLALIPSPRVRVLTDAYKAEWAALGRDEADVPPLGISRQIVIADTNEKAMEIANRAFAPFRHSISYLWHAFGVPMPPVLAADTFAGIAATGHCYAGDPAGARAWVAEHAETAGINYMSPRRSARSGCSPPRSCPRSPDAWTPPSPRASASCCYPLATAGHAAWMWQPCCHSHVVATSMHGRRRGEAHGRRRREAESGQRRES
jgi:hypothetical protein